MENEEPSPMVHKLIQDEEPQFLDQTSDQHGLQECMGTAGQPGLSTAPLVS